MAVTANRIERTMSIFSSAGFRNVRHRFNGFTAPRRPRHRILRVTLGIIGVGLLLALLFVSVFVGIAMLGAGMLWRLWKQRKQPLFVRGTPIDGDFRVVGKAQLPLAR
jgi:hypothetical protein